MSKNQKFGSRARKAATKNKTHEREAFILEGENESDLLSEIFADKIEVDSPTAEYRQMFLLESLELFADFYLLPQAQWKESWKIERAVDQSLCHLRGSGWRGSDEDVLHAFVPNHPHHEEACKALSTRAGKRIKPRVEAALDVYFAAHKPTPLWETVLGALPRVNELIELQNE